MRYDEAHEECAQDSASSASCLFLALSESGESLHALTPTRQARIPAHEAAR